MDTECSKQYCGGGQRAANESGIMGIYFSVWMHSKWVSVCIHTLNIGIGRLVPDCSSRIPVYLTFCLCLLCFFALNGISVLQCLLSLPPLSCGFSWPELLAGKGTIPCVLFRKVNYLFLFSILKTSGYLHEDTDSPVHVLPWLMGLSMPHTQFIFSSQWAQASRSKGFTVVISREFRKIARIYCTVVLI